MGLSFLKRKKTKDNFILENYSPPPTPDRDVDEESMSPHRPLAVLQPASDNSISPNINDDMNEEKVTLSLIHKRSMGNESKKSMNSSGVAAVGRPPVLVTPTKKQLSDATGTSSAGGSAGGGTPDTHIVSPPPALMSSHETPVHSNQQNLNKDVNEFIEEEKNTKNIIKEAEALLKKDKKKKSKKEKKKKKKKNFFGILPSKKDTAPISPMSTEEQDVSIPNDPDTSQYQTEILERVIDVDAGSDEDAGVELGLSMSMDTTQQEEQQNVETIAAGGKSVDIANWVPPSPVDGDVDQQPVANVFDANTRTANGDNMNEADALSETGGKNNLAPTSLFDNDDDGGTGEEEQDEGTDDIAQQAMPALIPEGSAIVSGVTSQGTNKKKKGLWKAINRGKSSRSRKFLYSSELSQQQQGQQQPSASSAGDRPTTPHSTIPSNKTPVTTTTDKSEKISKASLGLPEVPQDITADKDSSMPSMLSEPGTNKQQRAAAAMNSPQQPDDQLQGDDGRDTPANNTAKYSASTRPTSPGGTAGMMSSTMGETNTSASGAGFTTGLSTVTSLGRTYMSSASQAGGIDKLLSVFTCGDDTTIGNAVANVTNVMQCNKIPLVCGMGGELAKDEVDIELEMEEERTLNFQNVSFIVFLNFGEPELVSVLLMPGLCYCSLLHYRA